MAAMQATSIAATGQRVSHHLVAPVALFVATVAYLASLPANLSPGDEATFLLEAARVLDGEAMYRDVFDFITPGYQYLMALLFGLFGRTIGTARIATAVMHGLIGLGIYGTCRRIGIRPMLAATAALLHLSIDQPAWAIASQHWLSTLLCTLVLWTFARPVETTGHVARGGLLLGLLVMVQQQRGVPMVACTALWLVIDEFMAVRYGRRFSARALAARLAAFAGAIAAVVLPALVWCVARGGFAAVWFALVEFPLTKYGPTTYCRWGATVSAPSVAFTFPRLLAWLPITLALTLPRLTWLIVTGRDATTARQLAWLVVFASASIGSIMYFPDFVHIAFIAPVFYVLSAELVELAAGRLGGWLAVAATAAVLVLSTAHLARNWSGLWALFPHPMDSAFGRVDVPAPDAGVTDAVMRLAASTPSREVFIYPPIASIYLMSGARNPTRHTYYTAKFSLPDIVASLESKRTPYAVLLAIPKRPDPVVAYLQQTYEPMPADGWLQGKVLRRRDATLSLDKLDHLR